MNEQLITYKNQIIEMWNGWSKYLKFAVLGLLVVIPIVVILLILWSSNPEYETIYSNLTPAEAGEIKQAIEAMSVPVSISPDGRSISVPKVQAPDVKITLAAQGIPRSGNVNYGIFSENIGWGMTDQQFNVVERDAMQTEIRYLIEQMEGIDQANVMITLPEESIWLSDEEQTSTASVVLTTRPGLTLNQSQVNALYHVISKSIPKLPVENIVIMDQTGQSYELSVESESDQVLSAYQQQREIRREIEKDIQRELQQMLGLIMGYDKVVVSVMASLDFTKEKREEELVEPVIEEDNEGLAVSIERITESFTREGTSAESPVVTGETDIAGYIGTETGPSNSEYEKIEERINRDANRIYRQVELSPYVITDLTINVGIEPPIADDVTSLTQENIDDVQTILRNVVRTAISSGNIEVQEEELDQKISVFANEFRGRPVVTEPAVPGISPAVLYGAGAFLLLLLIAGLIYYNWRAKRRRLEEEEAARLEEQQRSELERDFDDFEPLDDHDEKRKRIERLAMNRPEEFAKLIKTWMAKE